MKNRTENISQIIGLLLFSFIIRLYAFKYTYVINHDGVLYINQANAILNGNWELAQNCGYKFISLYHILIPVFYKFFGDWIIAAKSISLLFGTIAIIPFYLILKQFFRNSTAVITSLAFSINPFFVAKSVDVIKDPIFWFFALLGIFFFIVVFNNKNKEYFLLFSSISFLIAGLARFEILVYFIGSVLYIFFSGVNRTKRLMLFSLPVVVACIILLSGLLAHQKNFDMWTLYLGPRIEMFFYNFSDSVFGIHIFKKTATALSLIAYKTLKVIYFPFVPLFLIGLFTTKKELSKNPHMKYIIFLSVISFFALYLFYLKIEILSSRYTALIVLPAFIFIGFGIKKIIQFSKSKGFQDKIIIGSICLYIIVLGLSSNLGHKRTDKLIYKNIGEYIAQREDNQKVKVMAPDARIMFYANYHSKGIECTNQIGEYKHLIKMEYPRLVSQLKKRKIKYFLWEEKSWSNADYDFLTDAKLLHFKEINRWKTKNRKFIAFKILH